MVWKRFFLARHLPVVQHSFLSVVCVFLSRKAASTAAPLAAAVITFLSSMQNRCKVTCDPLIRQWTNFDSQRTQLAGCGFLLKYQTHIYVCDVPKQVRFLPSSSVSSSCEWDGKPMCTNLYEKMLLLLSVCVCCVYAALCLRFSDSPILSHWKSESNSYRIKKKFYHGNGVRARLFATFRCIL